VPVPLTENAAGIDLSARVAATKTVAGSPALAAETIIASLALNTDEAIQSGVLLRGFAAFTVGTSGTAVTLRIRQTNVTGTVVATTGALTGGIAAAALVAESILGFDAAPAVTGQTYVLTLQVTAGSAASTVSAVELDATIV
jgi:hypothetical protein